MTIYKYPLQVTDSQEITMPAGAQILTVQAQRGEPFLWALVCPDVATFPRKITIHGTGHPIAKAGKYIATFQLEGGSLVFHAFDHG